MSAPAAEFAVPTRLEELDAAWLSAAFARRDLPPVSAIEVLQVIHGTATKVRLRLVPSGEAAAVLPETVWVKAGFEAHSALHADVYAGEVRFYNGLAKTLPDIPPTCLFADTDPRTGASLIVLDDLLPKGVRFFDGVTPATPDAARAGLSMIARYQARHWISPELARDPYMAAGGAYTKSAAPNRKYGQENVERVSRRPRWEVFPASLRDLDRMQAAMAALQVHWGDEPRCLNHGDAHVGQVFRYPDGRLGILDWQCAKFSNWAQDVAYFLVSALSVADRRAHEDALLAHYLSELAALGAEPPPFEAARETFRAHALHGLGWALCPPELQPEDICLALTERFSAAVLDCRSIDRLLG